MATVTEIRERNQELARQINEQARRDSSSPYAGKIIGIANGQVVVVTDDWNDLAARLRQVEPDPRKTFCLQAGEDYDTPQVIWEMR